MRGRYRFCTLLDGDDHISWSVLRSNDSDAVSVIDGWIANPAKT